ncbi:aspartate--tRNA ligase [Acidaminobacter sp. JC074]|uniref:aspartate--tRNA ligase n=1 Tax=Acidaminobacter sp. JC074 TaxID=2530199 RepID=UPI001F0DD9DE|nr:aspartate--tRNA ligase [Acidaminobacter sp. JC074]MCH4888298.1 aspartate--tRNA ligase [Acidaminobacter sp. JC074]
MAELLNGLKRTHYAGLLREEHIDQKVVLMGWVQKRRNLGGLLFVDLRDREGIAQVVFDTAVSEEAFNKADAIRGEYVIAVEGRVKLRQSINEDIPSGKVEVFAENIKVLSESEVPPIHINDEDGAGEQLRLKYRYLDLRKPKMFRNLRFRSTVASVFRNFFDGEGFLEVETPFLNKPTPEGARDYLVPSRVNPNKFYALPQSPQLFKQMLMVSGVDRYYQIVKCFRDEDLRADRQPEFTQVDVEMSFVEEQDVMAINEKLMQKIFKETIGVDLPVPFMRMPYKEAMERFGSDKPDLRFGYELKALNDVVENCGFGVFADTVKAGKDVRAININEGAGEFSKKGMKNLEKLAKTYGAKGLAWMKLTEEGLDSPIAKFLTEDDVKAITERMEAKAGDLILFVADEPSVVYATLGALRCEIAKKLDKIEEGDYKILWINEFPLFEYSEDDDRYVAKHHPFTSPLDEDMDMIESDPANCRAKAYDMVLNGSEIGGGSIRIHNTDLQARMFKALGFSDEEAQAKFGFLLDAFKYGVPPHGGIAYGLDRVVMELLHIDNIRDVIAFPKTQQATCLLTDAPAPAEDAQLEELFLNLVTPVKDEE